MANRHVHAPLPGSIITELKRVNLVEGPEYRSGQTVRNSSGHCTTYRVSDHRTGRSALLSGWTRRAIFAYAGFDDQVIEIQEGYPLIPHGEVAILVDDLKLPVRRHLVRTDFLLTLKGRGRTRTQVAIDVAHKSNHKLAELKKIWWSVRRVPFITVSPASFHSQVVDNLKWIRYPLINWPRYASRPALEAFDRSFRKRWTANPKASLATLCRSAGQHLGIDEQRALVLVRALIWNRLIAPNLGEEILPRLPLSTIAEKDYGLVFPWAGLL